jgi:hypothetical protein
MWFHGITRRLAAGVSVKAGPLKDPCYLGGWKSAGTVITCYQQPEATMQSALANSGWRRASIA